MRFSHRKLRFGRANIPNTELFESTELVQRGLCFLSGVELNKDGVPASTLDFYGC